MEAYLPIYQRPRFHFLLDSQVVVRQWPPEEWKLDTEGIQKTTRRLDGGDRWKG